MGSHALWAADEAPHVGAQTLKSPWVKPANDGASGKYNCPAFTPLPKDIVAYDFYTDAKHSIIDPARYKAYSDAEHLYDVPTELAEKAGDLYQSSGKTSAAACVMQVLKQLAASDAMTGTKSSNQAYYVQNWMLGGLAIAYLKARPAHVASAADDALITAWMDKVGGQVEEYFGPRNTRGTNDGQNNHYYWAGFAAMAAAVAANDHKLFDWALTTYWFGVHQIQPDGTLPLEMARGQRALHYHLFGITPLIMMAELGEANGVPMYAANNEALRRLAVRSVTGLLDNSYFAAKSGVKQDTPEGGKIRSDDIAWAVPYVKRFPNAGISTIIRNTGVSPYKYIGGMPPD
jgi:poly(beta-D-mannuronate) lyase